MNDLPKKNISHVKIKFVFVLSLMLAIFLLPKSSVYANTLNELIPQPVLETALDGTKINNPLKISGLTLSPTVVKICLDGQEIGYAQNEIGPDGWQKFNFTQDKSLPAGVHQLELVAEYYQKFESATTTVSFEVLTKIIGPTLLTPVVNNETSFQQPWIVGVTPNDTQVEIYIDEKLVGLAQVKNDPNGTASFKYKPNEKLALGFHVVQSRVVSTSGLASDFSNEVILQIKTNQEIWQAPALEPEQGQFVAPVPAPTLLEPKNGQVIQNNDLILKGVVHNNHLVKIFLDGEKMAEFTPTEHSSGVTAFSWQLEKTLTPGMHKLWAKAVNKQDQESGLSNIIKFITGPETAFVSQSKGKIDAAESVVEKKTLENKMLDNKDGSSFNWSSKFWSYALEIIIVIAVALMVAWKTVKRKNKQLESNLETKTNNENKNN